MNDKIKLRDAVDKDAKEYVEIPFDEELLEMYGTEMNINKAKSLDKAMLLVNEIKTSLMNRLLNMKESLLDKLD